MTHAAVTGPARSALECGGSRSSWMVRTLVAVLKEVRGKRVPQSVAAGMLLDARAGDQE
jgi:hypothetical protein